MDFRQLRNLVFVARHGSFGIAAEKLNVTQPALSKSVRALEQNIGARLLDRGPWGVKPTAYGARLIEYGEVTLALLDEARTELDAMRGARRGRLHVGAIATMVREPLPAVARQFLAAHPDVDLTLNEELSPALQALLLNGAIDLALMIRPRDFPVEELEFRELVEIPMTIVASRGHPLTLREKVSLADLCDFRWIIPARGDPDRMALDSMFAAAQLPLPRAICETTSSTFQVTMMAGSDWLSYLTSGSIYARGAEAPLVPLKLDAAVWSRMVGIAWRRRHVDRPVMRSFIRLCESACAELGARAAASGDRAPKGE